MTELSRIRTPLSQHIWRIRYQLIPVLTFLAAGCLTIWLWAQHAGIPNAVGMVEVVEFEITAPVDGVLMTVANGPWQRFQEVGPGVVVARLDSAAVNAARELVQQEVTRLKKELADTEAQVRREIAGALMDQANHERRRRAEIRALALDVQRLRLDVLGRRIGAAEKGLQQAREQLRTVQARKAEAIKEPGALATTTRPASSDVETSLAPIEAAIAVQEARMKEVQVQMEALEVRSPTDIPDDVRAMTISEIWRRPGQFVRAGERIITLAVPQTRYVVSYVRETQGFRPKVDMEAQVRIRTIPARILAGRVKAIGTRVAGVPEHQLRDPRHLEWGLPVRIEVDENLNLPPGELVDITFVLAP